jgi:hypothetical protein
MSQLVRLIDGREVDSSDEAWRHECEARAIADGPTLAERRAYLQAVEQARGKAARLALEATVVTIWQARRQGSN